MIKITQIENIFAKNSYPNIINFIKVQIFIHVIYTYISTLENKVVDTQGVPVETLGTWSDHSTKISHVIL